MNVSNRNRRGASTLSRHFWPVTETMSADFPRHWDYCLQNSLSHHPVAVLRTFLKVQRKGSGVRRGKTGGKKKLTRSVVSGFVFSLGA